MVRNLHQHTCGLDISFAHLPFCVVGNASRAAPLRDSLSAQCANMLLHLPTQLMGRSKEFMLFLCTECSSADIDALPAISSRAWPLHTSRRVCVGLGCASYRALLVRYDEIYLQGAAHGVLTGD
jgi:hypothetical protein